MGLGFIGDEWEVDWGVMGMMLSSIAPGVTRISQNFQKGVTEHNIWAKSLPRARGLQYSFTYLEMKRIVLTVSSAVLCPHFSD